MLLTTDAPDHMDLKERYTETLRGLLKEKTPSYGRCGGIHQLLDETTARPVLIHRPKAGRTWVWSDLHLGDTEVMEYCRRPFADADAMDRAIMAAWTTAVGPDDTILNGGDVALSGTLGNTRRAAIQKAPGRKLLVVGNHDFHLRSRLLDAAGHDTWTGVLVIKSDPPIVMTHVPMDSMPPGWANVHGHVHNHAPPGETPHINVCVEHTDYRPLPLESLVTLAKRLLAGQSVAGSRLAAGASPSGHARIDLRPPQGRPCRECRARGRSEHPPGRLGPRPSAAPRLRRVGRRRFRSGSYHRSR